MFDVVGETKYSLDHAQPSSPTNSLAIGTGLSIMASAPPFVLHQPRHIQPEGKQGSQRDHPHRARLPVIPDLRFEYSYLRSIRPFIEVERIGSSSKAEPTSVEKVDNALMEEGYETLDASLGFHGKEAEEGFGEREVTVVPGPREVIRVKWEKVLWVTMRDQVISPLLQGAIWSALFKVPVVTATNFQC